MTAAIHADGAAVIEDVVAGGDVDETDRAQPEFGRQGAGDQRDAADEAGVENAAETGDAVRQHHPVDAELDVGVIVADMQRAAGGGILRNSRGLQQHFLDRLVGALRQILDRVVADRVGGGAGGRIEIAARLIERAALCFELSGRRDRRGRLQAGVAAPRDTTRGVRFAGFAACFGAATLVSGSTVGAFAAGADVCARAIPAPPQIMSEAAAEANIRFANTDIVLVPMKARTDSFPTNSKKRLPSTCDGPISIHLMDRLRMTQAGPQAQLNRSQEIGGARG